MLSAISFQMFSMLVFCEVRTPFRNKKGSVIEPFGMPNDP